MSDTGHLYSTCIYTSHNVVLSMITQRTQRSVNNLRCWKHGGDGDVSDDGGWVVVIVMVVNVVVMTGNRW